MNMRKHQDRGNESNLLLDLELSSCIR